MEKLKTRLMDNCTEFLTARKELVFAELKHIDVTEQLATIELEARKAVLSVVDANGKALHSNEEKRSVAVKESLSYSPEYAILSQELKELNGSIMRLKATIEMAKYEKSVLQSLMTVTDE